MQKAGEHAKEMKKMQMYIMARAQHDRLQRWISDCLAQYFPYKLPDGRECMAQLQVRPIQILELAFPEPQLNNVIARVQPYNYTPHLEKYLAGLRMILGLDAIPKNIMPDFKMNNRYIHIMPIGLRKDRYSAEGAELI